LIPGGLAVISQHLQTTQLKLVVHLNLIDIREAGLMRTSAENLKGANAPVLEDVARLELRNGQCGSAAPGPGLVDIKNMFLKRTALGRKRSRASRACNSAATRHVSSNVLFDSDSLVVVRFLSARLW
jgi:hypothetical protein